MNKKQDNDTRDFYCKCCDKQYKTYKILWEHNKKFHSKNSKNVKTVKNNVNVINEIKEKNSKSLVCELCNKIFNTRAAKCIHKKKCKLNNIKSNEIDKLKEETKQKEMELEIKKQEEKILELKMKLDLQNETINKQLINIIVDKTKKIEHLESLINNEKEIIDNKLVNIQKEPSTLSLNNVIIVSRSEDNYINATQLCQAGGKKFNDWLRLETSKQLINMLESKAGIPALDLVEVNKGGAHGGSWIHPDLAIQLAQWISPIFALQVSEWIRTLFSNGNVSVDIKLLEDKEKEIKLKDQKIQLLEDTFNKKQTRENYPVDNVIYLLTTENHKKNRTYIVGKTINLKNRLSTYNKTEEHEVIYYKECKNRKSMDFSETMVINMLSDYKIKANRDRFTLPVEKDISYFTNIIDECVEFADKSQK
jgi:hypothetical protein